MEDFKNVWYNKLTSGFGTDFTMQTIWAVPPGIALTDSDSTVITGLTTKYKNTLAQPIPEYFQLPFSFYSLMVVFPNF